MIIGLTSAHRKNASYVEQTLFSIFNTTSGAEWKSIHVIVCLVDRNQSLLQERASKIASVFREQIEHGLLEVVAPPANIYPEWNFQQMVRTYKNSPKATEWRSKLALDFAFLFSYSATAGQSDYFLNMEDDVVPAVPNFIEETYKFIEEKQNRTWTSLSISPHLSIGRLYHHYTLPKLVEFILTSYTVQPVDFLMHYFDMIQLANHFKPNEFRRTPPLLHHIGVHSTKSDAIKEEEVLAARRKKLRFTNPQATITTSMSAFETFFVENAYDPMSESFFWAKAIKPNDTITIRLHEKLRVGALEMITGFNKHDNHHSDDRLLEAALWTSSRLTSPTDEGLQECTTFQHVSTKSSENGKFVFDNSVRQKGKLWCLIIQVRRATTDWLVIKDINILPLFQKRTPIPGITTTASPDT
ncbi:alpha-1,3-mannosyl-glycoprotein 4-beta-N-acetylglucosaminyltransferase C-like [Tigriopus californicus]|nr:alpha-1,3-mannosyl-glycoprotein 4-beta-N-acetylglucosaminyltransferase C-like [Tigriopus californicus]